MFETRVFNTLMQEMLANFPPDVRTDPASLAYNACAKIALAIQNVYEDMDDLYDNLLPDTMDIDHLITFGTERGVPYSYATPAYVRGVFSQEIEIGTEFECGKWTYQVVEALTETYNYKLVCTEAGAAANANYGDLIPTDYVENYQGGQITELLIPGEDDEDEEEYRKRVISSFEALAFGGSKADYRQFIDQIAGVGGCKPKRRIPGHSWIDIWVIDSDFNAPSAELIDIIQTAVDPEQNSGEGDGMAPICHQVVIRPVVETAINIETTVTLQDGLTPSMVENTIKAQIEAYLLDLRKQWADKDTLPLIVRVAQIDANIINLDGIIDVDQTTLNGSDDNVVLSYEKVPVLGEVVIHV